MQQHTTNSQQLKVTDYSWVIARLPFKQTVGHALKSRATTQSIILRLDDQQGYTGYGEGAPRSYVTHEQIDAIGPKLTALLRDYPIPPLKSVTDIAEYSQQLLAVTDYPAIVCSIETALLDLYGKQQQQYIGNLLPAPAPSAPRYSMVIPFLSLPQAIKYIQYAAQLQIPHVKIKVGFADDVNFVQQLLPYLPTNCQVRIDANRSWTFAEALRKCEAFAQLGIHYIEEPLCTSAIDQLPALSERVEVCLGLDESLYTLEHAQYYQARMATGSVYFNLKLSKCGGYLATSQIWSFARAHAIPCQLGCNVGETAILTALGRAFAQNHQLRFVEGAFNELLLEDDLTTDKLTFGLYGQASTLTQPGLGLDLRTDHPLFTKQE